MASPHFSGILPFFIHLANSVHKQQQRTKAVIYIYGQVLHAPLTSCCLPHPPYQKQFMEAGLNKH